MKKLFVLLLTVALSTPLLAQTAGVAYRLRGGLFASRPAACKASAPTDVYYATDTDVLYICTATNTWGAGVPAAGTPPGGSTTQVQYNNGGAFGGISGFTTNGSSTLTQTSTSATAFVSGPNGTTNPLLTLNNSTASQVDGIALSGGAVGVGTTITNTSSGSNSGLNLVLKGTGIFNISGAASTNIQVWQQGSTDIGAFSTVSGLIIVNGRTGNWYDGGSLASPGNLRMRMVPGTGINGGIYVGSDNGISFDSATSISGTAEATLSYDSAGVIRVGATAYDAAGGIKSRTTLTDTNCADSAGAAACGSASAGRFVMDASTTSVVVSTTSVTANSEIKIQNDASLGTALSVTCNTQSSLVLGTPRVTARTAGTSFTVTIDLGPTTNPMCLSYHIIN